MVSNAVGRVRLYTYEFAQPYDGCDRCGNIGIVLQTMGALIVGEHVPMPVMLLEVMGLALDYDFVDFGFNWIDVELYSFLWTSHWQLLCDTGVDQ
ncbi:hypothetical protein KY290_028656 [Solanum tuberosum]|uniref:Uncharacterized protein n=1 Tax=Solanum tuberosum TaxID=4113 RepID=A0ABQ7UK56_SOLTU|nr:hypothetical protein KY290_028656 [Solanum tuberosum]